MGLARWQVVALAALAGCFSPTYNAPMCGPGGACPSGMTCDSAQNTCVARVGGDAGGGDAPTDAEPGDGPVIDGPPIDGPPVDAAIVPLCDNTPELRLCMTMENTFSNDAGATAGQITFQPNGSVGFDPMGAVGAAARFPGRVEVIPSGNSLSIQEVSVEAFVSVVVSSTPQTIIDKDGEWHLFIDPSRRLGCRIGTSGQLALSPMPVPLSTWTHVACTDGIGMTRLYIDGVEVANGPGSNIAGIQRSIFIGQNEPTGVDPFQGRIDELRVFSRIRSAADIASAAARRQ